MPAASIASITCSSRLPQRRSGRAELLAPRLALVEDAQVARHLLREVLRHVAHHVRRRDDRRPHVDRACRVGHAALLRVRLSSIRRSQRTRRLLLRDAEVEHVDAVGVHPSLGHAAPDALELVRASRGSRRAASSSFAATSSSVEAGRRTGTWSGTDGRPGSRRRPRRARPRPTRASPRTRAGHERSPGRRPARVRRSPRSRFPRIRPSLSSFRSSG